MPSAEILVHQDEISIRSRVGRARCLPAHDVVRVGDVAVRVERFDPISHGPEVSDPAGRGGGAFVAGAPAHDARVVAGLLDHFAHHLFGERDDVRVDHLLLAELPHRNLGNQQDAVAVAVIQDRRVLRIMNGPGQRNLQVFEIMDYAGDKTEAASFLKGKGYMLIYSLVNSIFVDPRTWKK